jgi:formate/nitrite transporter FocA (FNT family)
MLLADSVTLPAAVNLANLGWSGLAANLVPVTLGNIVGGSVMVAAVYFLVYRRPALVESRTGAERTRSSDAEASPPKAGG